MKYFIQHLNMVFPVLSQRSVDGEEADLIGQYMDDILISTECLSRLVLNEQDQCQRNNSQIIAKFYEIGQKELALKLAEDFKVELQWTFLLEIAVKNDKILFFTILFFY